MKRLARIVVFLVSGLLYFASALDVHATSITFTDGTFNLATYSVPVVFNDQNVPLSIQQCTSCGNPGFALQEIINFPANTVSNTTYGLYGLTFTYTPSVQGAITELDFSVDRFLNGNSGNTFARPLVFQNGNYYRLLFNTRALMVNILPSVASCRRMIFNYLTLRPARLMRRPILIFRVPAVSFNLGSQIAMAPQ